MDEFVASVDDCSSGCRGTTIEESKQPGSTLTGFTDLGNVMSSALTMSLRDSIRELADPYKVESGDLLEHKLVLDYDWCELSKQVVDPIDYRDP